MCICYPVSSLDMFLSIVSRCRMNARFQYIGGAFLLVPSVLNTLFSPHEPIVQFA